MLYAFLIYQSQEFVDVLSEEEEEVVLEGHRNLQNDTKGKGQFMAATQLMPANVATTVRKNGDQVLVTDGPFGETKELFIGFYVFECDNLEQAIEYAGRIPHVSMGSIEIRPVAYMDSVEKLHAP